MLIAPGRLTAQPIGAWLPVACVAAYGGKRAPSSFDGCLQELFFSNNNCRVQNKRLITDIVFARHKTTYRQFLPTCPHNAEITLTSSVLPSRCNDRIQWSPKLVSHSYPLQPWMMGCFTIHALPAPGRAAYSRLHHGRSFHWQNSDH